MAKDILVTQSLSDSMIEAGYRLLERLDSENAQVRSAFWLYISDDQIWRLTIASPLVDSEGPRKFYKRIMAANESAENDEPVVSINDICVTNTNDKIVKLLQFAVVAGDGISGIRFSRNTINGVFIEDCYIYRSSAI